MHIIDIFFFCKQIKEDKQTSSITDILTLFAVKLENENNNQTGMKTAR